jgi:uncharacterized membrane protein
MRNKNIKALCCFIIGIIAGIIICSGLALFKVEKSAVETKIVFDTIFREIPSKPIILQKVKMQYEKVRDTIILTQPFIAKLDTIMDKDTVKAMYEYPENLLSLEIYKKPDSIMFQTITIYKEKSKSEEWWEKPVIFITGIASGFIISNIIR